MSENLEQIRIKVATSTTREKQDCEMADQIAREAVEQASRVH